jgi:TonB family protein
MNTRVLLLALSVTASSTPAALFAKASPAYLSSTAPAAVDANGARYRSSEYPGKVPPWMVDRVRSVSPDYPYWERAQHHVGVGYFQLTLDLKTGAVTKVTVRKSTGFSTLDNCAVAALRQWRWKPGKWKEVEIYCLNARSRTRNGQSFAKCAPQRIHR